jgi:hypothetical protein
MNCETECVCKLTTSTVYVCTYISHIHNPLVCPAIYLSFSFHHPLFPYHPCLFNLSVGTDALDWRHRLLLALLFLYPLFSFSGPPPLLLEFVITLWWVIYQIIVFQNMFFSNCSPPPLSMCVVGWWVAVWRPGTECVCVRRVLARRAMVGTHQTGCERGSGAWRPPGSSGHLLWLCSQHQHTGTVYTTIGTPT